MTDFSVCLFGFYPFSIYIHMLSVTHIKFLVGLILLIAMYVCVYGLHVGVSHSQFPLYRPELTRRVVKFLEAYHSNTPTESANDLLTPLNKEIGM